MTIGDKLTRMSDDELFELLEILITYINIRMLIKDGSCQLNIINKTDKGGCDVS